MIIKCKIDNEITLYFYFGVPWLDAKIWNLKQIIVFNTIGVLSSFVIGKSILRQWKVKERITA